MKELSTNSRLEKINRRHKICKEEGKCTVCPMHGGENTNRKAKRGDKKPRYKTKRVKS